MNDHIYIYIYMCVCKLVIYEYVLIKNRGGMASVCSSGSTEQSVALARAEGGV